MFFLKVYRIGLRQDINTDVVGVTTRCFYDITHSYLADNVIEEDISTKEMNACRFSYTLTFKVMTACECLL